MLSTCPDCTSEAACQRRLTTHLFSKCKSLEHCQKFCLLWGKSSVCFSSFTESPGTDCPRMTNISIILQCLHRSRAIPAIQNSLPSLQGSLAQSEQNLTLRSTLQKLKPQCSTSMSAFLLLLFKHYTAELNGSLLTPA